MAKNSDRQMFDEDGLAAGVPPLDAVPVPGQPPPPAPAEMQVVEKIQDSELADMGFELPAKLEPASGTAAVETVRAIAEVRAALEIARAFPRDQIKAFRSILQECRRYKLASEALYSYRRGGELVTGPSIRLAECLARYWGNVECGTRELARRVEATDMQAYAWDLETNTRMVRNWVVPHERKARGATHQLTDARDIYENNANQGSRRMRACILELIPGDIIERAVKEVRETLKRGDGRSLDERIREMVVAFTDAGVSTEQLEAKIGHPLAAITPDELVDLTAIYRTIKDSFAARSEFFGGGRQTSELKDLADEIRRKGEKGKEGGK